jgi:hypothetical protein
MEQMNRRISLGSNMRLITGTLSNIGIPLVSSVSAAVLGLARG